MMQKNPGQSKVGKILKLRCPNCGKAKVFHRTRFPFKTPVMKEVCEACGYRFNKEAGYYKGVFALSYGLAAIEAVIVFFIAGNLIYGVSMANLILISIGAVFLFASWNYRMSRVIWMNVFPE
jgi:hypothetical protein